MQWCPCQVTEGWGVGGNPGAQHPQRGEVNVEGAHWGLKMPITTWMGFLNTKTEKYVLVFCKNTRKWLAMGWGVEWGQK